MYTPSGRVNGRVTSVAGRVQMRFDRYVFKNVYSRGLAIADGRKIERDSLTNRSFLSHVAILLVLRRDGAQHDDKSATMSRRRFSVQRISRVHRGRGRGARIDPGNKPTNPVVGWTRIWGLALSCFGDEKTARIPNVILGTSVFSCTNGCCFFLDSGKKKSRTRNDGRVRGGRRLTRVKRRRD